MRQDRCYPAKIREYKLDKPLYMEMYWLVRGYEYAKAYYDNVIEETAPKQPGHTSMPTSSVERIAIQRSIYKDRINAIETAYIELPKEYRQAVWDNIVYDVPFPKTASRTTYWSYKNYFLYNVAKKLKLI